MKNRFQLLYLLSISLLVLSCNSNEKNHKTPYSLVKNGSSTILVEKFDSLVSDENKFNWNNEIFKVGSKFTYSIDYISPEKEHKFFNLDKDKTWNFIDANNSDDSTIKTVIIETLDGNPMSKYYPDYNQTAVSYRYKEGSPYSISGVIENEANIWMHPPREDLLKILELNPFPYIKSPYEVGTEWDWNLVIGNGWGDERWKTWEGQITNKMKYKITDIKTVETSLGDLQCFVVESSAKSEIGESSLKAFFNPIYGFVKMDYTNIDGSKILLELIDYIFND